MNESTEMLFEARKAKTAQLVESWAKFDGKKIRGYEKQEKVNFLEGITNTHQAEVMSQLYENTYQWLQSLSESTRTLQVGSFEKFVFPVLRAVMANLVASELVTVSPLDAPTGLVFYFDVLYGSNKGNIAKGSKMYDVRTGPSQNIHYTDEIVQEENVGSGNGVNARFGAGTAAFAYSPIRPGTVVITDGTQRATDNGNGKLEGDLNVGGANVINYSTGIFDVTFAAAPASGDGITATYEYNSEANSNTPEIDLQLTSAPVTARTQKLRARWSLEAQQDFQQYHGLNAEVELVAFMANEIAKELNYKIITQLRTVASAGAVTWDRTPPQGVPWIWHKESLFDALVQQSNLIFRKTQRALGNWVLGGIGFCNVVETLSKFKASGGGAAAGMAGVRKIGTIGDYDVYKHPGYEFNDFMMGHKGTSFLDTGMIYAPYLQLFTTGTITLDDMISRKGMGMRSGLKVVNSAMYATGTVAQTGLPF